MKPNAPKKQKFSSDVRRGQIVRAALGIVGKKGLAGLTTAAIAREVGVSEGNLYRHFKSKDDILAETSRSVGEAIRRNLETALNPADPPLRKLKRAFLVHLEYIERNEGIPRLGFSEEMHIGNTRLQREFLKNIGIYAAGLESLIREGQQKRVIRADIDAAATAVMLIGMVQITVMKWSLSGFTFSLTSEGAKLWKNYETCITIKKNGETGK